MNAEPNPAALARVLEDASRRADAGDAAGALATFMAAQGELSGFALYWYARGALLVRTGDVDAGVAALREAARIEPELPEVAANLGAALLERVQRRGPEQLAQPASRQDLDEAVQLLARAARSKPRLPEVHANHGRALSLAGRAHEALTCFERALMIDPRHVAAHYNKAAALHQLGREEDALATLDALLAFAPGFEPAVKSRANALARLGR